MSLNKVLLLGNLTRDPDLKYLPNGTAVAQFGLAMSEKWTDAQGQKCESVCFVDVEVWRQGAEWANKWLKKGREIMVDGKLKLDRWEDKQTGQSRQALRVTANQLIATGGTWERNAGDRPPPSDDGRTDTRTPTSRTQQRPASVPPPRKPDLGAPKPKDSEAELPEDDIPF